MTYSAAQARAEMLDEIAAAADELAVALAALGEAYEALDEDAADAMEQAVFRPVQAALGAIKRTHAEFAQRYSLPERRFAPAGPGSHTADPRVYVERALQASEDAEQRLAELQDSMRPVEVGDPQLRAGLSEARTLLADVPARGARLLRGVGR